MTPTHSPTLRCPNCKYDVSQTLRDAITTCPECGNEIAESKCIRVFPSDPIHIRLVCFAIVLISSFATMFATIALMAGSDPLTPLLVTGASIALLIIPSRLRVRRPPEAPFPRVPFEYFIHYSGMVLFVAAFVLLLSSFLVVAVS